MEPYIEFAEAVATPVVLIAIAFIFRRGIATKDDLAESERRTGEKIESVRNDLSKEIGEVRKDLSAEIGEVRKDLSAIREILAFIRGQSTPPSRVLQLPRHERGESERDEA